jgi:hypothetical protein
LGEESLLFPSLVANTAIKMTTMIEIPEMRPILNFRTFFAEMGGLTCPVD